MENQSPPSQHDKASRIPQEAAEFHENCQKVFWQIGQISEILPMLLQPDIRQGGLKFLKGFLVDYGKANRKAGGQEINVMLPIDAEIPFKEESLPDYFSHLGFWIAGVNLIKRHFGKEADRDIACSLDHMATLFPEAAEIFNQAQTSFERKKEGGLKFSLLRYFDNSRNAAPSLHVEIAAYTYSSLTDIIDKYAKGSMSDYEPIKRAFFQRAVTILEAVLLVKQHMVLDVGLGLAALTMLEKSFTRERAYRLIGAMFGENTHGIGLAAAAEIRQTATTFYDEVLSMAAAKPNESPAHIIVEYLKNFQKRQNTRK